MPTDWKSRALELYAALGEALDHAPDTDPLPAPATTATVTERCLGERRGYTVTALQKLRYAGDLVEGVHWFTTPKGKVVYDEGAFDLWQRGVPVAAIRESRSGRTEASASGSGTAASGVTNVPNSRPQMPERGKHRGSDEKSTSRAA